MSLANYKWLTFGITAAVAAIIGGAVVVNKRTLRKRRQRLANFIERNRKEAETAHAVAVVHFFTFSPYALAPSMTPFGTKVETYMRLAGIPYKKHAPVDPRVSPNRLVPFIVYQGECIADSENIIRFLSTKFNAGLDADLTPQQRALANAVRATIDYCIIPGLIRSVFCEDHFRTVKKFMAASMGIPRVLIWPVFFVMEKLFRKKQRESGFGLRQTEQFLSVLQDDLESLEDLLTSSPYLLGKEPTSVDCALFSVLIIITRLHRLSPRHGYRQVKALHCNSHGQLDGLTDDDKAGLHEVLINAPLQRVAESTVFNDYVNRISARAFPDLEEVIHAPIKTSTDKEIRQLADQAEHLKHTIETQNISRQASQ